MSTDITRMALDLLDGAVIEGWQPSTRDALRLEFIRAWLNDEAPIRSGTIYKVVGLPGQYDTARFLVTGSVTMSMGVNCYSFDNADDAHMGADGKFRRSAESIHTIMATDLVTAVENGWLVEVPA